MIIKFPDLQTLVTAIQQKKIPEDVMGSSFVGFSEGSIHIEPSVPVSRTLQDDLRSFNVQFGRKSVELSQKVDSWKEILSSNTGTLPCVEGEVLFQIPSQDKYVEIASSLYECGAKNQKVEMRDKIYLLVERPSFYHILKYHNDIPIFVEDRKGIWCQIGYKYPFKETLVCPQDKILLLSNKEYPDFLPKFNFKNNYQVNSFDFPKTTTGKEASVSAKLELSFRLRDSAEEVASELWVVYNNPFEVLQTFVQDHDDEFINKFSFAIGKANNKDIIVLKAMSSKYNLPIAVIDGIPFYSYLKFNDLFVPVGKKLFPDLRRDIIRKNFVSEGNIVWINPDTFTIEKIPLDSFVPLREWVNYDFKKQDTLSHWKFSHLFEFARLTYDEVIKEKPKVKETSVSSRPSYIRKEVKETRQKREEIPVTLETSFVYQKPSEAALKLKEMEGKFLSLEGSLSSPERNALWIQLARLNSVLEHIDDSRVCWVNVIWNADNYPDSILQEWFNAEKSYFGKKEMSSLKEKDFNYLFSLKELSLSDVNACGAYIIWAERQGITFSSTLLLGFIKFFEKYEKLFSVRAYWLVWNSFYKLANKDVLSFVKAKDRLMERLFYSGLRPEQDFPSFLRFSGDGSNQRFRGIRDWLMGFYDIVSSWIGNTDANTQSYARLMFAYAFSCLGERDISDNHISKVSLDVKEVAHKFLKEAFLYRIGMIQEGKKNSGPLPGNAKALAKIAVYAIDRLRQCSRILEPFEEVDPFIAWSSKSDELSIKLLDLMNETDKKKISDTVHKLLKENANKVEAKAKIFRTALEFAPKIGEDFALMILNNFCTVWDNLPENTKDVDVILDRAKLLERGIATAAHFDRKDFVQFFVVRFQKLLEQQKNSTFVHQIIEKICGEMLRGLRKFGMRDEINGLLQQMTTVVLKGNSLESVLKNANIDIMQSLLFIASGWIFFGQEKQADAIVSASKVLVYKKEITFQSQMALCKVYLHTISGLTLEVALRLYEEFFKKMSPFKDSLTTNKLFNLFQLDVIDKTIVSLLGDNGYDSQVKKWLDEEEFIVRRRINKDYSLVKT